jgi:nucleoside-diphosphate-sugar epimerase
MGGPAMARFSDIGAAREKVVDWLKASEIDYTVFRPTGYYNDITLLFDKAATKGVVKLYGDPEMKSNPLHAADFADLVAKAIETPEWKNIEKDVGGPEIFTRRQLAELAFKVLGKEPNIQVKPLWQFAILMYSMRFINFNIYHIFKFLHFTWSTPWMAGTKNGHRKLGDYWEELKKEGKVGTGSAAMGL